MHVNKSSNDALYYSQLKEYAESHLGVQVTECDDTSVGVAYIVQRRINIPPHYFNGYPAKELHVLAHELGHIIADDKGKDFRDEVLAWDIGEKLLKQRFGHVPSRGDFQSYKLRCLDSHEVDIEAYLLNKRIKLIGGVFAYGACITACIAWVTIAAFGYSLIFNADVQPSSHEEELYY